MAKIETAIVSKNLTNKKFICNMINSLIGSAINDDQKPLMWRTVVVQLQRAGDAEIPAQRKPSGWPTEGAVKKSESF